MKTITMLVANLTLLQKLQRGEDIITKETNNPNVPGNATTLAAFSDAQEALQAAQAAVEGHRTSGAELMSARDAAETEWLAKLAALAGFTESATGGDPTKILSTGFGVKGQPVPPQPVEQIQNVKVTFNGEPGKSVVRWKADPHADAYVVECCADPITPTGWKYMNTVPRPKFIGNGATPGQVCWYRVRGINGEGEGPWSEPAMRPVM